MIRAIIAAAMAAIRSMKTWCARTGAWISNHVIEPGVEYFHEAVHGATQAVTGLIPDVIKGAAKLPGQAIRGTGALLEGGGKLAGSTLSIAAAFPGAIASGLAGSRNVPAPPQQARQSGSSEEVTDALEAIEAGRYARETIRSMRSHEPISLEADLVHRYASADTYERDAIDLDELPPHIADWLEALTERHLAHLAQSPSICMEAVAGRRTGLVGMPLPERLTLAADERLSAPVGTIGQVLGDPSAFAARVAAVKGTRRDRQPH